MTDTKHTNACARTGAHAPFREAVHHVLALLVTKQHLPLVTVAKWGCARDWDWVSRMQQTRATAYEDQPIGTCQEARGAPTLTRRRRRWADEQRCGSSSTPCCMPRTSDEVHVESSRGRCVSEGRHMWQRGQGWRGLEKAKQGVPWQDGPESRFGRDHRRWQDRCASGGWCASPSSAVQWGGEHAGAHIAGSHQHLQRMEMWR